MTGAKLRGIRHTTGSVLAFGAICAAAATNQGCGGGKGTTTSSSSTGSSMMSSSSSTSSSSSGGMGGGMPCNGGAFQGTIAPGANGGFTDAFDAAPSSDGSTVFFTAVDMMGNPGVFKQGICKAGMATAVYTGGVFEAPFGIAVSTDDQTLYVADLSAEETPADTSGTKDRGALYSLSAAGGTAPSLLVGSVRPRSLTVVQEGGSDQIYFTGVDKANGLAGVFKVAAAGGGVTTIAEGPPFSDPGGVTVSAKGDVYVLDTSGSGTGLGAIIVVPKGGAAAVQVSNIQVGYPAGIAIMHDDSKLLASGLDLGAQSDVLVEVDLATMMVTNNSTGIGTYGEAAGLHRAHKVDVFAWADTKAKPMGMSGTGTVFVIK